jgi:sRNA-binding regulator protein Hfq
MAGREFYLTFVIHDNNRAVLYDKILNTENIFETIERFLCTINNRNNSRIIMFKTIIRGFSMTKENVSVVKEKKETPAKKERPFNNHHQHPVQKRMYDKCMGNIVAIHTTAGKMVTGRFVEHDQFTVAIEKEEDELLFYKHGIIFIRLAKSKSED